MIKPDGIDLDTPLRLGDAVKIAFPLGGMTVSGLRREIKRERLTVEIIAGKQFVSLRQLEEMRDEMPRRSKGPRLWLQPARKGVARKNHRAGRLGHPRRLDQNAALDAARAKLQQAARRLKDYLNAKPTERVSDRDPSIVPIADVVAIYSEDVVRKHARPKETAARLSRILDYLRR